MFSSFSPSMSDDQSSREYSGYLMRGPDPLMLTKHEKFAIWTDREGLTSIISVDSEEVVFSFMKRGALLKINGVLDRLILGRHGNIAWPLDHLHHTLLANLDEISAFITWNGDPNDFQLKYPEYILMYRPPHFEWTLDARSALFFRTQHTTLPQMVRQRVPLEQLLLYHPDREPARAFTDSSTNVQIVTARQLANNSLFREPIIYYKFEETPVAITLPVPDGLPNQRRPLEMKIQFMWESMFGWQANDGDVLQTMGTYLVFHSGSDQSLVVIDFWPSW
jgi:hypothetical protein